tara:strand:+ start:126 stop:881 length:756 start_codon:yes stop_codon:yes gene_type:complete
MNMAKSDKTAKLYRMVTDNHICPFGIKSKDLLERKGYKVEDHHLKDRSETDAFKEKHDVKTTPQTFIDGKRIGGYDDLRNFFGMKPAKPEGKTYTPVLCVFAVTFLMALGAVFARTGGIVFESLIVLFVGFSMSVLAILKFRDMFAFTNQFVTYDLLARRWVPYAYIYPYAEVFVGLGMVAGILTIPVAVTALIIGSIGAASVIKAVYIDKRDLKCACVGGNSNVPLGALSLTENLMMVGMGLYMLFFMAA